MSEADVKHVLDGLSKSFDADKIEALMQLIEMHIAQLASSGLPQQYWPFLFEKLTSEV